MTACVAIFFSQCYHRCQMRVVLLLVGRLCHIVLGQTKWVRTRRWHRLQVPASYVDVSAVRIYRKYVGIKCGHWSYDQFKTNMIIIHNDNSRDVIVAYLKKSDAIFVKKIWRCWDDIVDLMTTLVNSRIVTFPRKIRKTSCGFAGSKIKLSI